MGRLARDNRLRGGSGKVVVSGDLGRRLGGLVGDRLLDGLLLLVKASQRR